MGLLTGGAKAGKKAAKNLLDMATDARMKRAAEQGFGADTWYHGTNADFDEFSNDFLGSASGSKDANLGHYFSKRPQTADAYRESFPKIKPEKFKQKWKMSLEDAEAEKKALEAKLKTDGIEMPSYVDRYEENPDIKRLAGLNRITNQYTYEGAGFSPSEWLDDELWGRRIEARLAGNMKEVDMAGDAWDATKQTALAKDAAEEGYDGIIFKDMQDSGWFGGSGTDDIAQVFDPRNIRSTNAAFDPSKRNSANLLAGAAGTAGVGLLGMGSNEAEAGPVSKTLQALLKKAAPDADSFVSETPEAIHLSKIVVPKDARGSGQGSRFMDELNAYADKSGKPVVLTADGDFGGSKAGQQRFYKRHGFTANKGKNKDYRFTENMIRNPAAVAGTAGVGLLGAGASNKGYAAPPTANDIFAQYGNEQQIQPAKHPKLAQAAGLLQGVETPLDGLLGAGWATEGVTGLLDKLSYGDKRKYSDYVNAAMDFF